MTKTVRIDVSGPTGSGKTLITAEIRRFFKELVTARIEVSRIGNAKECSSFDSFEIDFEINNENTAKGNYQFYYERGVVVKSPYTGAEFRVVLRMVDPDNSHKPCYILQGKIDAKVMIMDAVVIDRDWRNETLRKT